MWAPRSSPVLASNTVFTKPSGSPSAIALPLPMKGNLPTLISQALGLGRGLGEADAGDLRLAIGAARDVLGLHRVHALEAGDLLDHHDALVHGLVGEPRRAGDVADRVDVRLAGEAPLVDHDVGLLDLHLGAFEAEVLDIADDADGADDAIDGDLLALAARRDGGRHLVVAPSSGCRPWRRSGSSCPASRRRAWRRPRPPRPRPAGCGPAPRPPSPRRPWCGRSSRTRCRSRPSRSPAATWGTPAAPSLRGRSRRSLPSDSRPGSWRARAPVARITFLAVSDHVALVLQRHGELALAALAARELGVAVEHRDLVLAHQHLDAVAELVGDLARALDDLLGVVGELLDGDAEGVGVLDAGRRPPTVRSSALVGMQPQLRQMPPMFSRSTTAVLRPSCAARIAAT